MPLPTFDRIGGLVTKGRAMVDAGLERVDTAKQNAAVDLVVSVATRPNYTTDTLLATYFAMRLFILMFPLAYVAVAGIGLYSSQTSTASTDVSGNLGVTGTVAESIAEASRESSRSQVLVIIVGLAVTAWAGRSTLRALRMAHATVWRTPVPKTPLAEAGGLIFALVVAVIAWLGGLTSRWRHSGMPILLSSGLLGVFVFGIWLTASIRLPRQPSRVVDLVPGAVLVGLAAPAMNLAAQLYFGPKLARSSETYGALGASVVILAYLLALGWIVVAAAEINAAVLEWRNRGATQ